jgi:SAM-dependent methyltransferase
VARPSAPCDHRYAEFGNGRLLDLCLGARPDGPGRAADLGCGSGGLAAALAARGWDVVAVEADPPLAEAARTRGLAVVEADLTDPAVYDDPALAGRDLVVLGDVLEHLADPVPVLAAAAGLLAPGGRLAVSVPNVAFWQVRLGLLAGRFDYAETGVLDRTHLRFFTRRSLREALGGAGLSVVAEDAVVPLATSVAPRLGRLGPLAAGYAALGRRAPGLMAFQLLALCARAGRGG